MTIINMPYSDKGRDEHDRVFGKKKKKKSGKKKQSPKQKKKAKK